MRLESVFYLLDAIAENLAVLEHRNKTSAASFPSVVTVSHQVSCIHHFQVFTSEEYGVQLMSLSVSVREKI